MNVMQRQSDRKDKKEHEQNVDNILTLPINRNVLTKATKHIKKRVLHNVANRKCFLRICTISGTVVNRENPKIKLRFCPKCFKFYLCLWVSTDIFWH